MTPERESEIRLLLAESEGYSNMKMSPQAWRGAVSDLLNELVEMRQELANLEPPYDIDANALAH